MDCSDSMMVVLKWPLLADRPKIGPGQVLHVEIQHDVLTVWTLEKDLNCLATRDVKITGTGHRVVPEKAIHLGTVVDGMYVWHLFDVMDCI